MPVVALDATPLLGIRTGVGATTDGLLRALAARADPDLGLVAFAVTWKGRGGLAGVVPPGVRAATAPVPARLARRLWERGLGPRVERWTGPVDVVHATNFVAPPARAPVLVTLHDLTFLTRPDLCTDDTRAYEGLVRRALDRGATIHAFSATVAEQVVALLDVPPARVVHIPPGVTPVGDGDAARGRELAGAPVYVLALGTVEPRKNLPTLVRAAASLAADRPGLRVVVAGPDGWDGGRFAAAVAALPDPSVVRRLGYVDEVDRRDLLAGAAVLAYPSLDEGFGHPPLEALLAGVPVVAGRAGALPEVLGDAALLVDPLDVDALAGALGRALDDAAWRTKSVAAGRARAAGLTWDRAAESFAALYRDLACAR